MKAGRRRSAMGAVALLCLIVSVELAIALNRLGREVLPESEVTVHSVLSLLRKGPVTAETAEDWEAAFRGALAAAQGTSPVTTEDAHKLSVGQSRFEDPVKVIVEDLLPQSDLIPFDGVHGSTMGFSADRIHVLHNRYVLAYFEDGHIGGYVLLRYRISDEGQVSWKVIDAFLRNY